MTFIRIAILDLQCLDEIEELAIFKELIRFGTLYLQNKNVFREPLDWKYIRYLPKMPM